MEEAFWAARQGDALLHTSFMADVLGAVLEVPQMSLLMPSLSAQPRYWRRQWGSRWGALPSC